jgi:hypothetical protein
LSFVVDSSVALSSRRNVRQRIDADRRRQRADFLHDLPLAIDPETTVQLSGPT